MGSLHKLKEEIVNMAEELPVTQGEIAKLILEFDDLEKELHGAWKELMNNIIPEYEPAEELGIFFILNEFIEMINITCYYERVLLHHIIVTDETIQKEQSCYSLKRVFLQRENINNYISKVQQARESITNRKASDLIDRAIKIIFKSLQLMDKCIRVYDVKENDNLFDSSESEGVFEGGDRNGVGTVVYPGGEIYIGQCKDGIPFGYGTVTYPDGSKYEGHIENNKYCGQGLFTSPNLAKYEGEFKDDKFSGQGTLTNIEGNVYVGQWKDGVLMSEKIEGGPYQHQGSGISFPENLGGMERGDITNYEITKPGFGISVGYNIDSINATIYIYDCGISNIPAGVDSGIIKDHFNEVIREIFEAYELGMYDGVVKLSEGKSYLGNSLRGPEALSSSLMISQYGFKRLSHIYLGVYNNQFLKIRFSYNESIEIEGAKTLSLFLNEIAKLLNDKMISK